MLTKRISSIVLLLIMSGHVELAQDENHYWPIIGVPDGKFYYRNKPDEKIPLSGNFTPLFETSEVWCEAKPCELNYASRQSEEPQKLNINLIPKKWTSLTSATPKPEPPVIPLAVELINTLTGRAGREKGGLCSGSMSVQAPACEELIDVDSFSLEWTPPPDVKGRVQIRVTQMDSAGSPVDEFPPVVTEIEDGHYSSSSLREYLSRIQRHDGRVTLRIDLARSESEHATRVVQVPSVQEQEQFRRRMREMEVPNTTLRALGRMWVALQDNRWTVAAREALIVKERSNVGTELLTYALVGLCRSSYDDSRETLRARMVAVGVTNVCPANSNSRTETAAKDTTEPPKAKRVGIALLIGNSDYPEDQLDAVRHDVEGMAKVLTELGFEVVEAENLDTAQEFRQTTANFLLSKGANADDVVFVYYSGHGMQFKGKTYLLGKNYAQLGRSALAVLSNAYKLDDLVDQIQTDAPAFARVVVFDACRNNVFANEDTQEGDVAFGHKYPNTFILLANRPGKTVAARATGEFHSPFTEGLIYGLSRAKGGLVEVFQLAKEKTEVLSPGQQPELLTSDPERLDRTILSGSGNKAKSDRPREMIQKACAYYHSRAWDTYLPMMRVANALVEDSAMRSHISAEIQFAELIQKAEVEAARNDNKQAAQSWKEAAALFPSRNWVRMKAALAALAIDDVQSALEELAEMPSGPDGSIPDRADLLWAELAASFPQEARLARAVATKAPMAEEPECVVQQ